MKRMMATLFSGLVLLQGFAFAAPKTTVVLWNRIFEDWNRAYCEKMAAAYNAQSTTVNLDQQFIPGDGWDEKMKAAQASGTAPDIYLMNYGGIPWLARDGLLLRMDNLLPAAAWNDLYDNVKKFVSYKGGFYAYPQLLEPATVLYYRKDLFQQAGLDPNKPPRTWDELIADARKLTTKQVFGLSVPGFGGDVGWSTWGWQATASGHMAISDDWSKATVQDQGYLDLANFFKRIYAEKVVPAQPLGGYADITPFAQGGTAMAFCGSWAIGEIRNNYKDMIDKIGVAAAPTKDGKPFTPTVGGWTYVLDAKTKVAQPAADYINWLLASDPSRPAEFFSVAKYSKFSPRKSVDAFIKKSNEAMNDPWMKTISEQVVPYTVAEPLYAWDISMAVDTALQSVVVSNASPADALAKAADSINNYIQSNDYSTKKP